MHNSAVAAMNPEFLRCEYLVDPTGIDSVNPRLSWILASDERDSRQTARRIIVGSSEALVRAGKGDLWDSEKQFSSDTTGVIYEGKPLSTGQMVWWCVKVWDQNGKVSDWSQPAKWEMGLLDSADWKGKWIARSPTSSVSLLGDNPLPLFRREFEVEGKVKSARVHVAGLGFHELRLNGEVVGDHLMDPAFTRYDRTILYVTHDVTDLLKSGKNTIGAMLGNGWFNVHAKAAWHFDEAPWRATPRLLLEMQIEMEDGRTITVSSDEHWKTNDGPILFSSIYGGENFDARKMQEGWDCSEFDDCDWANALVVDAPKGTLAAQSMHPVRVTSILKPVSVTEIEPGVNVFDFGQNLTGNVQIILTAPEGSEMQMRYGEKLQEDGSLDQSEIAIHVLKQDSSQQFQTDKYICRGGVLEEWKSRFTYHGFQYMELTGDLEAADIVSVEAHVSHTDVPNVGHFESSNATLNKIWENGRWSYLGNLYGIPTDCPHREKNGWTGDAQIACEQGLFYQDGITLYEKWIGDLDDEQFPTGALPGIVPTNAQWGYKWGSGPAWDSALLLIPWHLYEYYGDKTLLKKHYVAFKNYVDYLTERAAVDGIVDLGLADWCVWKAKTPAAITDTAYYYRDAQIVAEVAQMLGLDEDVEHYSKLAGSIKEAFNREFLKNDNPEFGLNTQTALGCALYFDLVREDQRDALFSKLVSLIRASDNHLDFGFLGTKYVFNTLSEYGESDLAYQMIMQPSAPSYAWQIAQGATTLWEAWDGTKSRNHTFFGDVNAWIMKNVVGINPDPRHPGFNRAIIKPQILGDLEFASGYYDSVKGRYSVDWKIEGQYFQIDICIPSNCSAEVYLPTKNAGTVLESGRSLETTKGLRKIGSSGESIVLELGSGNYSFSVYLDPNLKQNF